MTMIDNGEDTAAETAPKRSRKRKSRLAIRQSREDLWRRFREITLEELTEDRMRGLARELIARADGGDVDVLLFLFGQDPDHVAGVRHAPRSSP